MALQDLMSSADVSGGYDPTLDFFLPARPENPKMRESASFWVSDDKGRIGIPRICVEAVAGYWDSRGVQANIAFPDGRVLIGSGGFAPAGPPKVVDGHARTLNAGPLTFEVLKPLSGWRMTFDGDTYETTSARQIAGEADGPRRRVRIELEANMAAPPWTPGEQAVRAGDAATAAAVGGIGGHRHEQLFRCHGSVQIGSEPQITFDGRGLCIRRWGVRDIGEFPGHCWMSALFHSGRAFGLLAFPPRADGTPAYNEAFIYENGVKHYASVVEAPWMTEIVPHGGAVDAVLRTEDGRLHRIQGRTHDTTYVAPGNSMFGDWAPEGATLGTRLPFHQGGALYTMGDESAYGMIERSLPVEQMKSA